METVNRYLYTIRGLWLNGYEVMGLYDYEVMTWNLELEYLLTATVNWGLWLNGYGVIRL